MFLLLAVTLLLAVAAPAQAQNAPGSISGRVTEAETGEGIPGANVVIVGTQQGASTGPDGSYVITNLDPGTYAVQASFVGYETATAEDVGVEASATTTLELTMKENTAALDEVVVVGYGEQSRSDLTGSVASIETEDITKAQSVSFERALAGRVAGVQVTSSEGGPGAGVKIRIRGNTSINASNAPLYVIDGFPVLGENQATSTGLSNSSTSPLSTIDPESIKSIEILKDASATAIYGSRGANGVVLITTKDGRGTAPKLNVNTYTGVSTISSSIDVMAPETYVDYWNDFFPYDPEADVYQQIAYRDTLGNSVPMSALKTNDWPDQLYRSALMQNVNASLSGFAEGTNYYASVGFLNQNGSIESSDFKRITGAFKLDRELREGMDAGVNLNVGYTDQGGVLTATSEATTRSGVVTNILLSRPAQPIFRPGRNTGSTRFDDEGNIITDRDGEIVSPDLLANRTIDLNDRFNGYGQFYFQWEFLDGLTFKSSLGGNANFTKGKGFYPAEFGWGRSTNGRAIISESNARGWLNENTLKYQNTFGDAHALDVTTGFTAQKSTWEFFNTTAVDFDAPGLNLDNLGSAGEYYPSNSNRTEWSLLSFLSRVNYRLLDRYLFTFTSRYDGSSRFAKGRKYGFFPSGALAWRVSEEPFMEELSAISNLKLRASYGLTGNSEVGVYQSLAAYSPNAYSFGGSLASGLGVNRLANPDLTWETTRQLDVGLDLGFFEERLTLTADYYRSATSDLLLQVPIPFTSGFEDTFKNVGEVSNEGLELSLSTVNVQREDFSWTSSLNISFNRNEVQDLGPEADRFFVRAIGGNVGQEYLVEEGRPLGLIYGLTWGGIYNYDDFTEFDGLSAEEAAELFESSGGRDASFTLKEGVPTRAGVDNYNPGMIRFKDLNGDGVVNADDRGVIGDTNPDHYGGLSNSLTYKGVDLSFLFSWSYGNDVFNKNRIAASSLDIPFRNKIEQVAAYWRPNAPDTDIWSLYGARDGGATGENHSFFVEDGSYLRLNNVTLGYQLPAGVLQSLGGFDSARIYASVDNVHVWTNYSGYDPDVSVGNNALTPGLDFDSYPQSRTIRVGLELGL